MPFAWDCRNTQANKENMQDIGEFAFAIGTAFMVVKKKSYSEMYLQTLTITEKDIDKIAKHITLYQIFKDEKGIPNSLDKNKELIAKFIGSKFWRSMK